MDDRVLANRRTLRVQLQAARLADVAVPCATCGEARPLWALYRCYECGLWFCRVCGAEHWPEAAANREAATRALIAGAETCEKDADPTGEVSRTG